MAEAPRYVVDASVAVKWHLEDEPQTDEALAFLDDYREARISVLAPDHIRYEVPSAIKSAVAMGRINASEGRQAIELFLVLRLPAVRSESLLLLGYEQATRYGCSFYDGLYLALAAASRCPLVHADLKLKKRLQGRFPFEMWIEDYQR